MAERISEAMLRKCPVPASGNKIVYDDLIKGFGLRVTAKGSKSFVLNYHVVGQERRITIGQPPSWTVAAARDEVKRLRRDVDQGRDPLAQRNADRAALTVRGLWDEYSVRELPSKAVRAQKDVKSMWERYVLPRLGGTKLAKLTSRQIDDLHRAVSDVGKTRANRVVENLRSALNHALRWGWVDKNPANGFRRHQEQPREMYLSEEQIGKALAILARMKNQQAANLICLLILTGCRVGEAMKAEWSQFDLILGKWTKPSSHTKQKRVHHVPLFDEAVGLLLSIQKGSTSALIFSSKTGRSLADISKPWQSFKRELGLPQLRIHDLRHTYASHLISQGVGLAVVGNLLGHTQYQTTLRYSHLLEAPLREATGKVGKMVANAKA